MNAPTPVRQLHATSAWRCSRAVQDSATRLCYHGGKERSMHRDRSPTSWFDIPEARPALVGHPLALRAEWLAQVRRATCDRCGQPVHVGEPFLLAPYCAMGGTLDLAPEALAAYADTLEVTPYHATCGERPCLPVSLS